MKCPYCDHTEDRVLETREQKEGSGIRRRRECLKCRQRFSTHEVLLLTYPLIIKKDGRREEFNKEKIQRGLQAACQKRPIASSRIDEIVDRISGWVCQQGEKEVASGQIGLKVMTELRKLDSVAYVRFASVYRTFKDVQEFVETLEDQDNISAFKDAAYETPSPRDRSTDSFSE